MLGRKLGEVHINREGAGGGGGRDPSKAAGFRKELQEKRAARTTGDNPAGGAGGDTIDLGGQQANTKSIAGSGLTNTKSIAGTGAATPETPTPEARASTAASKTASAGAALKGLDIEDNPAMAEAFSTQPASSSVTGPTGTSVTQPKEMSFTDRLSLAGRVTKANLAQLDDASVAAAVAAPGGFAIPAKAAIEGAAFAFGGGVQKFGSGASGGERGKEDVGLTRTTSPTSVASTLATTDETDEQRAARLKQRRLAGTITSTGSAGAAAPVLFGS